MTNEPPSPSSPLYEVSIWEGIAIAVGALLLAAIGLAGLGIKALNNAFNPQRAEAIAKNIIAYDIPDGSRGLFGANVGGAKIAVVASMDLPAGLPPLSPDNSAAPPAVELLVARIPVSQEERIYQDAQVATDFFTGFSFSYQVEGAFDVAETRTEYREFCGSFAPVTIQKGVLTIANPSIRLPAVIYEVNVARDRDDYTAVVTAVGQTADADALTVFRSLRCVPTGYQPAITPPLPESAM